MSEDVMIGLETHVQLNTDTKLFCNCPNEEAEEPNSNVCEICLGHPGTRPRLNEKVLQKASKVAVALGCEINSQIFFSRKTYFYPDMSKNYQITQYEIPVGEDGEIRISTEDSERDIGIKRLHIEEDPAKINHAGGSVSESNYTKVDYNRAGTPLIEIVTKPDFRSPEEAREYLKRLERMLEYLEVYSSGSSFTIKSDANVSIEGGEKVEVKNITGTSEVEKALSYEISRQRQVVKREDTVTQQTRSFNPDTGATKKMREKETEEDYGYIFDPDLTRQKLDEEFIEDIKSGMPELPGEKLERFKSDYGLEHKLTESLITNKKMAEEFEELAEEYSPDLVASWMTGELKKTLNYNDLDYTQSDIQKEWLGYILGLIEADDISDRNAEEVLRKIVEQPRHPEKVVEEEDLLKAGDDEVESIVESVLEENQDAVDDYNSGDEGAINFLVGQVMQQSQGKADPKGAREKIMEKLDG